MEDVTIRIFYVAKLKNRILIIRLLVLNNIYLVVRSVLLHLYQSWLILNEVLLIRTQDSKGEEINFDI